MKKKKLVSTITYLFHSQETEELDFKYNFLKFVYSPLRDLSFIDGKNQVLGKLNIVKTMKVGTLKSMHVLSITSKQI